MPCSNCQRLYSETGIKTPHWYIGNRNTCPFPGGNHNRGNWLSALIRDDQGNVITDEQGTFSWLSSNQISEMWGEISYSYKRYYINALIRCWCARITSCVSYVLSKRENNFPSDNTILTYMTTLTIACIPRNEDHNIISQYNSPEKNPIINNLIMITRDYSDMRRVPGGSAFRRIKNNLKDLIKKIEELPRHGINDEFHTTRLGRIYRVMSNTEKDSMQRALQREKRRLDRMVMQEHEVELEQEVRRGEHRERRMTERHEARRANIEAERRAARTSQISIRRFEAPTPSPNIHKSSQCPVCMEDFVSDAGKVNGTCGHQLCITCFSTMVITTGCNDIKCPLCRDTILKCTPHVST
jgi:hypothetical protein